MDAAMDMLDLSGRPPGEQVAALRTRFRVLLSAAREGEVPDHRQRLTALEALRNGIQCWREEFIAAATEDFGGRSPDETLFLEVIPLLDQIRHTRRRLGRWMRPLQKSVGWQFLPGKARVLYQPLGVVGILGAWNYPFLLILSPLVSALAAGNRVLIKPSERAPRSAAAIGRMVAERFPADQVTTATGGPELAAAFSALPFDHLFFTGSSRVGKLVMRAASENLTPVTLELGGKSPALIQDDFPVAVAATRILTGKLYNAGQTCIAPDYVLLPKGRFEEFVAAAERTVSLLYPRLVASRDYTRIVDSLHYERLEGLLEDARAKGAHIRAINPAGEACSRDNRVMAPTLAWEVTDEMYLMKEEIFGPILPLIPFGGLDEALQYIGRHPPPLSLYYFDRDRRRAEEMVQRTVSGGACVNDVIVHFAQNELPFGGVGASGMGRYHGFDGFETFSHKKGVFIQSNLSFFPWLRPPYGRRARFLQKALLGKAGPNGDPGVKGVM